MREALRYLRLSGAAFAATVTACVCLQPGDVMTHNGLSFYGNFQQTLLPYGLGLGLTALALLRASQHMPQAAVGRGLRLSLSAMAAALLGVVVTPSFAQNWLIQLLHVLFAAMVFVLQLAVSWRATHLRTGQLDHWLFRVQLGALAVAMLSFGTFGALSLMLPAQALAIASFGALLLRTLQREPDAATRWVTAPVRATPPRKL